MPGLGLTKPREFTDAEKQAMTEGAADLGIDLDDILSIWGSSALDVHLNGESFWDAVPVAVCKYTIGGYLVQENGSATASSRFLVEPSLKTKHASSHRWCGELLLCSCRSEA